MKQTWPSHRTTRATTTLTLTHPFACRTHPFTTLTHPSVTTAADPSPTMSHHPLPFAHLRRTSTPDHYLTLCTTLTPLPDSKTTLNKHATSDPIKTALQELWTVRSPSRKKKKPIGTHQTKNPILKTPKHKRHKHRALKLEIQTSDWSSDVCSSDLIWGFLSDVFL